MAEMEAVVTWQFLIEVPTIRHLAGIDLIRERISDETSILAFRHLLKGHNQGVKTRLIQWGMTMREGTIVHAKLIAAARSASSRPQPERGGATRPVAR